MMLSGTSGYNRGMGEDTVQTDAIAENIHLTPGTRVAIRGVPTGVTLDRATGTIVRPDVWDGYYIIRLDAPALYHHADGRTEHIRELREAGDNLDILPSLTE